MSPLYTVASIQLGMSGVKHPLLICFHGARRDKFTSYLFAHKGLVTLELLPLSPHLMNLMFIVPCIILIVE